MILIIIILILVAYIIKMKIELRNISKHIKDSQGQYINIRTKTIDKDIEDLVVKINFLYDEIQKIKAKNIRIEEELKRSIANMSHDLRTPLTSIMGYMQLIKNEDSTESEKKEYMEIVEKRTKNLQMLISSFYDLSRLNSSEYKFNLKKVSLDIILCDVIAIYYNDFINKNIEPEININDNISWIISDEGVVNRIFSNLTYNMLKYGEGNIKISLTESEDYIISEFKNFAPNLDRDSVDKLFDRFYTADKSRTNQSTGLGLAITKAFVEKLGNEIKAEMKKDNLVIIIKWKKNVTYN